MSDEELLNKYHLYVKKRRILFSILLFFLIILAGAIIHFFPSTKEEYPKNEIITDVTPPIIKIKTEKIEIFQDDSIDYLSYVESVIDDVDGDLLDKIQYNLIDTSATGTYEIVFHVSDTSNNVSEEKLIVIINEKPEVIEPSKEEDKSNSSINNSSENLSTNNPQEKPIDSQIKKPTSKVIKYFLFEDGYTMANVAEVCANELKSLGVAGMCSPIQDDSGIYLGMKLETN